VRARDSATPGPSFSSSTGMTSSLVRERAKAEIGVAGIVPGIKLLCTSQISSVSALRRPRNGRSSFPRAGRIPASDRVPEPRARPSSTCSAWSSSVCPRRMASALPTPLPPPPVRHGAHRGPQLRGPKPVEATVDSADLHRVQAQVPESQRPSSPQRQPNRAAAGGPQPPRPPSRDGRPRGLGAQSRRPQLPGPGNRGPRCRPPGRVRDSRLRASAPCSIFRAVPSDRRQPGRRRPLLCMEAVSWLGTW
jgi:hypothetical protein